MTGTAFHTVSVGLTRQVKLLLRSGLNVNIKNEKGQNLLIAALKIENHEKRFRMFRMLTSKGVNLFSVDPSTGRDVLIWACALNRHREIEMILEEGMSGLDLCRRDERGFTGLHYAAMNGSKDTCRLLCEAIQRVGLSVDVPNNQGFTPFILAKRLGHGDCVAVLLKVGHASPHQFDTLQYKMAENWSQEGQKERTSVDRKLLAQRIIALKTLGRMPQLHDANYKPSDVKIVVSKQEKSLLRKMHSKGQSRPWSAPNSAEKRNSGKKDHLKSQHLQLYEAKALGDSVRKNVVKARKGEVEGPGITIQVNGQDVVDGKHLANIAQASIQNSISLPDISHFMAKTETDLSKVKKDSSRVMFGGQALLKKNPWYPPSKVSRVNLRKREKSDLELNKSDEPASKVNTNISQLLGVMAEQNTHSFRSGKRSHDSVSTLQVDRDVASFMKSQKAGANKKGGSSNPGKWKGKNKLEMGSGSLDIIREEM